MIKEILKYPDNKDILCSKSEDIKVEDIATEEIQNLIQDLKDTLHNTTGVGISAVQIGVLKRICIVHCDARDIVLINPVITRTRGEVDSTEGCLSAKDNTYTTVKRFQKVWIDYYNEKGIKRELAEGGMCSIIAQHELDHFEGGCVVFDQWEKNEELASKIAAAAKGEGDVSL